MKTIIIIGNANIGKTALLNRHLNDTFSPEYSATFGCYLTIKPASDARLNTLSIWNCSGHERYRPLLVQFIQTASDAILCFDLTNKQTFTDLTYWINEVKRITPDAKIILVGLKSDIVDGVKISLQQIQRFAKDYGIDYVATSAKTDQGIQELFQKFK